MTEVKNIANRFATNEVYSIFSACMYLPTWEKFCDKALEFLSDKSVHIFGYTENNCILGICVVKCKEEGTAEVKGIAVDLLSRNQGIGQKLIQHIYKKLQIKCLTAETDDDAVAFYRKCGFDIVKTTRNYEEINYTRYVCTLCGETES